MKPILFNTEMVRAILDGRKTVTRRACKSRTFFGLISDPETQFVKMNVENGFYPVGAHFRSRGKSYVISQPYSVGDILYVRETWGFDKNNWLYKAAFSDADNQKLKNIMRWQPSIHMPKEAARIFLRVTGVRVERLMDITESGARAEGFSGIEGFQPATKTFFDTWRAIYGDEVFWVWVIEFERCEKEED